MLSALHHVENRRRGPAASKRASRVCRIFVHSAGTGGGGSQHYQRARLMHDVQREPGEHEAADQIAETGSTNEMSIGGCSSLWRTESSWRTQRLPALRNPSVAPYLSRADLEA